MDRGPSEELPGTAIRADEPIQLQLSRYERFIQAKSLYFQYSFLYLYRPGRSSAQITPKMEWTLVEGFLLLALDNRKGAFLIDSIALNHGLAGAVLMKLIILKRIRIEHRRVYVVDTSDTGSPLLNSMLDILAQSKKQRKVKQWVTRLAARLKKKKQMVIDRLVEEGVLKKQRTKILGFIPHTVYPTADTTREDALRSNMMAIIQGERQVDPKSLMLLSLLEATKLTRVLFSHRKHYRQARKRIRELTSEYEVGNMIHTTIREVCSVVITASTSATVQAASGPSR